MALKKLQYKKINNVPLYIEYAPIIDDSQPMMNNDSDLEASEEEKDSGEAVEEENSIFVKNINFDTDDSKLSFAFKEAKIGKVISARIVRTKNNLSKGFGFVEMDSKESALKIVKNM